MKTRLVVATCAVLGLALLLTASSTAAVPFSMSPPAEFIAPNPTGQSPPIEIVSASDSACTPSDFAGLLAPLGAVLPDANGEARVIIQMQGEPVGSYRAKTRAVEKRTPEEAASDLMAYASSLEAERSRFQAEVKSRGIPFQTHRTYEFVLNGLAATIRVADVAALKDLADVKAIHPDRPVEAHLTESVPLIGADQVWAMADPGGQPVTGLGIQVAVIDTGVDYSHPDLGGCFGVACRVVGGYDFVNDDADPRDDNGHGTHVAGIIGADGVMQGVAPDVSFYAYKVLGSSGTGLMSDVIAALDAAVDPDGDPLTADAVDVANLSLGGAGGPDDPVSLAVDAAVDQDVVVVVSAGNAGPNYNTISAPGVARGAITVGASDKGDQISSFSSRGPVPDYPELVKPDIVAPGAAISAPYLAGGYAGLSGTSMASPHIAGAAALLKQLHPSFAPDLIRANLMNVALDLGSDVFTQGAGRVQVAAAAAAPGVLSPGSLGLGAVDISQPIWTQDRELRLTSLAATSVEYALSVSGSLPAGVTASFEPSSVALGPGESVVIRFTLTVDNAVIPYPTTAPAFYTGKVVAASAAGNLVTPFTFTKGAQVEFTFDEPPYFVGILEPSLSSGGWWKYNPGSTASFRIPPGTYDVWVEFDSRRTIVVVREEVEVTEITRLTVDRAEAHNTITLRPRDKNGQPIIAGGGVVAWQLRNAVDAYLYHAGMFSDVQSPAAVFQYSDMSPKYILDWRLDLGYSGDWYEFNDTLNGISADVIYENSPDSFRPVEYHFDAEAARPDLLARHGVSGGPFT